MGFPKSLQQPFRKGMLLVGGAWRGFFSAYNATAASSSSSTSVGPSILDLQVLGPFNEASLPSGWFDLGWINKFKITPGSKIGLVRSGYRGAVRAIYRGEVGETFEFTFRESTRMAWKIASGTEVFNLLSNPNAAASQVGPLSSSGTAAVPLAASGYQAAYTYNGTSYPVCFVAAGQGANFSAGQYIVCDNDYLTSQYGLVGAAGIPVWPNTVTDVDFIRKTSDFIATILAIVPTIVAGMDGLLLTSPFVGGGNATTTPGQTVPSASGKIQIIKGYVAREGGTYVTEWSALFCMDTMDVSQIAIYYPHVAANQFKDIANWQIENAGTTDLTGYELDCTMQALAFDDPIDGETVVRYAAYYPSPSKTVNI